LEEEEDDQLKQKYKIELIRYFCIFIVKIAEMTKNRSLTDEYKTVLKTSNQTGFENFSRQLALAISSILRTSLTQIENLSNTSQPNEDQYMIQQST
jgi:hypothetical protein